MTASPIRPVIALAVVLAGAATTTACLHPRVPPPAPAPVSTPGTPPTATASFLQGRLFTVTVGVEPARLGRNHINIYATTSDGREASIQEWRVTAANLAGGTQPISAETVVALRPGHAVAAIDVPAAGVWRFSIKLHTRTDEDVVYADIRIS